MEAILKINFSLTLMQTKKTDPKPLVSIFCFCKNSERFIESCIQSVLNQTYENIEFIIQDGGSTDGTINIIKKYGNLVNLESCEDNSPDIGFWRALKRCNGDIIGSCQSDERLMPYAAQWAVDNFALNMDAGLIYGDTYIIDEKENITQKKYSLEPFSVTDYLLRSVHFEICSAFFRKEALLNVGLHTRKWKKNVSEHELILELGLRYPIIRISGLVSRYMFHKTASSQSYDQVLRYTKGMESLIDDFCSIKLKLPQGCRLKQQALGALYLRTANVLQYLNKPAEANAYFKKALQLPLPIGGFLRHKNKFSCHQYKSFHRVIYHYLRAILKLKTYIEKGYKTDRFY